jgi:putative hydrolase of the HAD superfamily
MDRKSVKVIFFDLGNVILPFNHYPIAEKLSRFARESPKDPSKLFSYLFDFEGGAVNLYETGKISSEEFFRSLKESFRLSLSFEEFVPIWNEIFSEDGEVSEILRSLKREFRLGLISNTNPLHFDYIVPRYPIVRIFEKWILSHQIGFKKPAPEIFRKAIEWASVEPRRILFIDDTPGHVEAAVSLGLQALHFRSADQLNRELKTLF